MSHLRRPPAPRQATAGIPESSTLAAAAPSLGIPSFTPTALGFGVVTGVNADVECERASADHGGRRDSQLQPSRPRSDAALASKRWSTRWCEKRRDGYASCAVKRRENEADLSSRPFVVWEAVVRRSAAARARLSAELHLSCQPKRRHGTAADLPSAFVWRSSLPYLNASLHDSAFVGTRGSQKEGSAARGLGLDAEDGAELPSFLASQRAPAAPTPSSRCIAVGVDGRLPSPSSIRPHRDGILFPEPRFRELPYPRCAIIHPQALPTATTSSMSHTVKTTKTQTPRFSSRCRSSRDLAQPGKRLAVVYHARRRSRGLPNGI
uniref:Uncharacterized protein n=1 Tax=Mycena chlorophos TaxID=658473 RepID=A0ABQ0M0W1_MYCCL|nr:predicted protein [Mycena chlorophos]